MEQKVVLCFYFLILSFDKEIGWNCCHLFMQYCWIKSVSWDHSCEENYIEEYNKEKDLKYSLLIALLPRNRLDPHCFMYVIRRTLYKTKIPQSYF